MKFLIVPVRLFTKKIILLLLYKLEEIQNQKETMEIPFQKYVHQNKKMMLQILKELKNVHQ